MRKLKIVIIIVFIILIILTFGVVIINKKGKLINQDSNLNSSMEDEDIGGELPVQYNKNGYTEVNDKNIFFTVTDCVQNYLDYINPDNNIFGYNKDYSYTQEEIEDERKNILLDLMSQNYIEQNNIVKDNIYQYINNINEYTVFIPNKIIENSDEIVKKYILEGNLLNSEINKKVHFIVYFDVNNYTFSIQPILDEVDIDDITASDNIKSIDDDIYNEYSYADSDDLDTITRYSKYAKQLIENAKDEFYDKYLDEEYKNKRFKSKDSFYNYIESNINRIEESSIKKYKVNEESEYTEYIYVDQYNNTYIFSTKDIMKFTIKLDDYTLDSKSFYSKYNNGNNELKVKMNLEKVFQALNTKDYEYVYNKLDDTFKQNNFSTMEEFENYIKNNLFEINKVEYVNFEDKTNIFVYKLSITDYTEQNKNEIEKSIIMKLEDETNFKISFNI